MRSRDEGWRDRSGLMAAVAMLAFTQSAAGARFWPDNVGAIADINVVHEH